mgnify:CR=1 FL=1
MTVDDLKTALGLSVAAGGQGLHKEITGCYIGDLLSWVMGRAKDGDAWLTVMGNRNAIAVAALADTACIVLVESAPLDGDAREKADEIGMPVLLTEKDSFSVAAYLAEQLR